MCTEKLYIKFRIFLSLHIILKFSRKLEPIEIGSKMKGKARSKN